MTKDEYIEKIMKIYNDNNHSIIMKDIDKAKGVNRTYVKKFFGSFSNMCKELNLNSPTPRILTNDEIIEIVKEIHAKYGKITKEILVSEGRVSADTIKRRFGSLNKLYEICDFPLQQGQRKFTSKDEIVEEINRIKNIYGYVSKPLFEKHSSYSPKIVQRVFGSFSNMYSELGLERHKSGRIPTDEELISECKKIYNEQGFLSYDLIEKFGKISATCYKDRAKKNNWDGINYYREVIGCEIPTLNWNESPSARYAINKFSNILNEKPIKEKKFDWLIDKTADNPTRNPLRIDAYYPEANIAVEYNGPQHYYIDGFYTKTEEDLKHRQRLDKLKADLIKEHGIKLIVIHFKDKVTDEYIHNAISNNN